MAKSTMITNFIKTTQKFIGRSFIFSLIERTNIKKKALHYPPIFIIGAPRSGTTILYQLLVKHYHMCFFTNAANFFYRCPFTANKITTNIFSNNSLEIKESEYGLIKGFSSPSEGGGVFRYWFNSLPYTRETKELIYKTVSTFTDYYGSPFISKNLYNSFRINKLVEIFPNALFIIVTRDIKYNAQSLLLARKKQHGDFSKWFGLKPDDFNRIVHINDPYMQVIEQISSTKKSIDAIVDHNKSINTINVTYENLCLNTQQVISNIENIYNQIGKNKLISKPFSLESIKSQNVQKLSADEWNWLTQMIVSLGL